MKALIYLSLTINFVLFFFGIIAGYSMSAVSVSGYAGSVNISTDLNNWVIVLLAIGFVLALVGLKVMGSGLSDSSVKIIITATIYIVLWAILSVYSLNLLVLLPMGIGNLLYSFLTVLYAIGCFMQLKNGGSSG